MFFNSLNKTEKDSERKNITLEIRRATNELEEIRRVFDSVEDPELLEHIIFREKAALSKLSYLIRNAKRTAKDTAKSINI